MSPRNKLTNEKMRDERREQILKNALKLFARRGLSATRISDIAQLSGFSQGLVYHYFPSKEDLYLELIKNALSSGSSSVQAVDALPLSPMEKLELLTSTILKALSTEEEAAYMFLMMTQVTVSDAVSPEIMELFADFVIPSNLVAKNIAEAQKLGLARAGDPMQIAIVYWAAVNGLAASQAANVEFTMPDAEYLIRLVR